MQLYLAVRGSQETEPRLFPLEVGRAWVAGRYMGPLDEGRYIRDDSRPLEEIPEYIPLEADLSTNRFHFEAGCDETGPWVRDISNNGTLLNGIRLRRDHQYPLCVGDVLQVRGCSIVVVRAGPSARAGQPYG